jgi:hypothetical protein
MLVPTAAILYDAAENEPPNSGAAMNGLKNASPANAILEGLVTLYSITISPLEYQTL